MPAQVVLRATTGVLAGQEYVFDDRTTCLIGRSRKCDIHVPSHQEPRIVSRHHCLLDINPPEVCVRDLGSLNGTFVNGRELERPCEGQDDPATVSLKNGDQIQVGDVLFSLSVVVPPYCPNCGTELNRQALALRDMAECPVCYLRVSAAALLETPPAAVRRCASCGQAIGREAGDRQGEQVCEKCRSDPFVLVRRMIESAGAGLRHLSGMADYELVSPLGQGGMGSVYLARHRRTGRQAAIKILLPNVAADPAAVQRFLRETELSKALRHPNVVEVHESGCHEGAFFLAMEHCPGGSVDQCMKARGGKLPIDEALAIVVQVLAGLDYAHRVELKALPLRDGQRAPGIGVVHRDIKPGNILLGEGQVAKIGDYGLAKAFDLAGLSGHTRASSVGGTPYYIPRQQVLRFKFARPEVDVWAAAATLYCLITGRAPRRFPKGTDPWLHVLESAPVPILQRSPEVPPRLAAVIDEALIDDPEIRVKTAADLKAKLEDARCRG